MPHSRKARWLVPLAVALVAAVAVVGGSSAKNAPNKLDKINHIVVIYEENHSFDNLYGTWEGVDGIANADAAHTIQVAQNGTPYACLLQNDVNLTSPPLGVTCTDAGFSISSAFPNGPFLIDSYIPTSATTCPKPNGAFFPHGVLDGQGLPGGCTTDIVHRYYQEQYQLDGGKQDRYVTGSDAVGLTMGRYDTQSLPIYKYLHQPNAPHYAIADRFFQGAFGGSYLNHIYLVSASAQLFAGALNDGSANDFHSIVDTNGMPNNYPLYHATTAVKDSMLTVKCPAPAGAACGDYAVNTTQPSYWPYSPTSSVVSRQAPLTTPNIGDELSAKGVDWAWYSGGWSNANGYTDQPGYTNGTGPACSDPDSRKDTAWPKCPDVNFQYHHQAFNYWATYAPGTAARAAHLQDEVAFENAAASSGSDCNLKAVSFIKPVGEENEHPGYTSETRGSNHLVELLQSIEGSACAKDTMVVVTYDEFGGQWDHVPPPGQGSTTPGPHDKWGPGTRIPALIVAPGLPGNFVVDHTSHDTSSILATIEHRFDVPALSSRDAQVADLSSVYDGKQVPNN